MKILYEHIVPPLSRAERLRIYAQNEFKHLFHSNKGVKKAIDSGQFLLNDIKAETGSMVNTGDNIIIIEKKDSRPIYPLKLSVICEQEDYAIIYKVPGLSVHGRSAKNLVNALPYNLKPSQLPDALSRPMPVHRLDAQTSGLMIIAKSRNFQIRIGKMFEEKEVNKTYTAIVLGKLEGEGKIDFPVENKRSISKYRCISNIVNKSFNFLSLLELSPLSGRTHQLRIHCAHLGHPILGERLYGTETPNIKGKGLFLVATKLDFIHPISKERLIFECNPPKKFKQYFDIKA